MLLQIPPFRVAVSFPAPLRVYVIHVTAAAPLSLLRRILATKPATFRFDRDASSSSATSLRGFFFFLLLLVLLLFPFPFRQRRTLLWTSGSLLSVDNSPPASFSQSISYTYSRYHRCGSRNVFRVCVSRRGDRVNKRGVVLKLRCNFNRLSHRGGTPNPFRELGDNNEYKSPGRFGINKQSSSCRCSCSRETF